MARPQKIGLDYYPTDVGIVRDIKVQKLLRYHKGPAALGVLIALFSLIYDHGYYLDWDDDQRFILSKDLYVNEEYIQEIIDACLAMGIFDSDLYITHKILTSHGIQQRYVLASQRRRVEIHTLPHIYPSILKKELSKHSAKGELMHTEIEIMHTDSTQSKVKKSKDNPTSCGYPRPHTHEEEAPEIGADDAKVCADIDTEVSEMRRSPIWKEHVFMRFKFLGTSEQMLNEYLDRWAGEAKISCKHHDSLGDAKHHFCNWMIIQENMLNKNGRSNGADNNNGYRSREDMLKGTVRVMSELIEEGDQYTKPLPVV